jgi:hypothetical protein
VYDMYYWDEPDPAAPTGAERRWPVPTRAGRHRPPGRVAGPAAQAVQVALDRRDNGGDSSAPRDQ